MQFRRTQKNESRNLKWVLGTTYAVQGSSSFTDIPSLYFVKFALEMGDAGGQLFQSLKSLGWLVKPLWGLLSDRVPLLGYRRKSWFILMAALGFFFWLLNAALALLGIRTPAVFLIGFNLAFSSYAFVDVVADALMVERGRKLKRVGSYINFQWTVLSVANAAAVALSGWLQEKITAGEFAYWGIFALTAIPPLFTAAIGYYKIEEAPGTRGAGRQSGRASRANLCRRLRQKMAALPSSIRALLRNNTLLLLLVLFIVLWNFSPSIGYIERSYLIDRRGFDPAAFGTIFTLQAIAFLLSILAYRFILRAFPSIRWYHYLYAMIAIMIVAFPLSFYLYLDPQHPWWDWVVALIPPTLNPVPQWNRYVWFRIVFSLLFGFATIPAFMIPLRVAGEVVKLEYAGMGYAFLMSLSNVTNTFEGLVGSALYWLFTRPQMSWLLRAFHDSPFDISGVPDTRTLILQLFVYISLAFTLLALPVVVSLKRALARRGIEIHSDR
jgi:MFS family permease